MPVKTLFWLALVAVALPTPLSSPPLALLLGCMFGLTLGQPYPQATRKWSKWLLQASIVSLGFGMNFGQVLRAGSSGFIYTLAGITLALGVGMLLARAIGVHDRAAYLISSGTAICGGSAIAAIAPVINASEEEISVSMGTVFLLNAIALFMFPPIGRLLQLDEAQFGLWAALAIHDTSSVVGAGAKYGIVALAIATTVKLARALWIVPLTLSTAAWLRARGSEARSAVQWPWFIVLFVLAAALNSQVEEGREVFSMFSGAGRVGLTVTLFLIGMGMTRASLRSVGIRPLVLGIVLWLFVCVATLAAVHQRWIHI